MLCVEARGVGAADAGGGGNCADMDICNHAAASCLRFGRRHYPMVRFMLPVFFAVFGVRFYKSFDKIENLCF